MIEAPYHLKLGLHGKRPYMKSDRLQDFPSKSLSASFYKLENLT